MYLRVNRLLDVVAGLTLGLAFIVAVPFVAIGNLLGNRGPLIYSQPRVGKLGEEFRIHKLRTMVPLRNAGDQAEETTKTPWTEKDDPRVTPFGKVLRKLHIDELPQAANILRGAPVSYTHLDVYKRQVRNDGQVGIAAFCYFFRYFNIELVILWLIRHCTDFLQM